jgi:hypothetical protein
VDGGDVRAVWEAAQAAIERARSGGGPTFLHARCIHLEGHFLGFQPIRIVRHPFKEMPPIAGPLARSFLRPGGAGLGERLAGLRIVLGTVLATARDPRRDPANDPVRRARAALRAEPLRLQEVEDQAEQEIGAVLESALAEVLS